MSNLWIKRIVLGLLAIFLILVVAGVCYFWPYEERGATRDAKLIPSIGEEVARFATPGEELYYIVVWSRPYINVMVSGRATLQAVREYFKGRDVDEASFGDPGPRSRQEDLVKCSSNDPHIQYEFGSGDWLVIGPMGRFYVEFHYRPDDGVFTLVGSCREKIETPTKQ